MAAPNYPRNGNQWSQASADSLNCFNKMDSKLCFEIRLIVVELVEAYLLGRCASFMILTATVSEIFGGQTHLF